MMQTRMRVWRTSTWLGLAVGAGLLGMAVVVGVVQYLKATAIPLHPVARTCLR